MLPLIVRGSKREKITVPGSKALNERNKTYLILFDRSGVIRVYAYTLFSDLNNEIHEIDLLLTYAAIQWKQKKWAWISRIKLLALFSCVIE